MDGIVTNALNHTWRFILSVLGVVATLIGTVALLITVLTIRGDLDGGATSYMYFELGSSVLEAAILLFMLFSAGAYLIKKGEVVHMASQAKPEERSWTHKIVPMQKILNVAFIMAIGFALGMYAVSYRLDSEQTRLIKEKYSKGLPYLDGRPSLVYSFAASGYTDKEIVSAVFISPGNARYINGEDYDSLKKANISQYDQALESAKIEMIEVVGYADSSGDTQINKQLSHQRTLTIRRLLIDSGVPAEMISVRAGGEKDTGCEKYKDETRTNCLARARRVEVYFLGNTIGKDNISK